MSVRLTDSKKNRAYRILIDKMGFLDTHAHTAVSATINKLIEQTDPSGDDGIMEAEIGNLLDTIRLQKDPGETGPTEAARAIRKKLKYGSVSAQVNALNLLNLLVANGGEGKMALFYNDRKLLDRLVKTVSPYTGDTSIDRRVVRKARELVLAWKQEYGDDESRESLAELYKRCGLGRRSGRAAVRETVPDFMNDEADEDAFGTRLDDEDEDEDENEDGDNASADGHWGVSSRSRDSSRGATTRRKTNRELDKQFRIPRIDYDKETPRIYKIIAQANVLSINLEDSLRLLGPGELSIHSEKANKCFDECRLIRRRILRYLQLVDKEELLSALLKCNDDLVVCLKHYAELSEPADARRGASRESVDASTDDDSLSEYETDDSLDDGLASRFRDMSDAPIDAPASSAHASGKMSSEPPLPRVPVRTAPPKRPTKPAMLRVSREKLVDRPPREVDEADPFSDNNKVDRGGSWM